MKNGILIFLLLIFTVLKPDSLMSQKSYTYLALGDSYTIGERVLPDENFPSQTVQLLRNDSFDFHAPEILAKTGWTTDELQSAMNQHNFSSSYDFVSLLIGVNNQYRGRSIYNYKTEFEKLLKKAVSLAGGRTDHVLVLSVPDWSVTPFAKERDRAQIANEINAFNAANKQISLQYNVQYLDITAWTREAVNDPSLLAADGLHPSAKEYRRWAEKVAVFFKSKI